MSDKRKDKFKSEEDRLIYSQLPKVEIVYLKNEFFASLVSKYKMEALHRLCRVCKSLDMYDKVAIIHGVINERAEKQYKDQEGIYYKVLEQCSNKKLFFNVDIGMIFIKATMN